MALDGVVEHFMPCAARDLIIASRAAPLVRLGPSSRRLMPSARPSRSRYRRCFPPHRLPASVLPNAGATASASSSPQCFLATPIIPIQCCIARPIRPFAISNPGPHRAHIAAAHSRVVRRHFLCPCGARRSRPPAVRSTAGVSSSHQEITSADARPHRDLLAQTMATCARIVRPARPRIAPGATYSCPLSILHWIWSRRTTPLGFGSYKGRRSRRSHRPQPLLLLLPRPVAVPHSNCRVGGRAIERSDTINPPHFLAQKHIAIGQPGPSHSKLSSTCAGLLAH